MVDKPRLALITAFPDLPSNVRLLAAAEGAGLDLAVLHPGADAAADRPDGALLRLGLEHLEAGLALGRALAGAGTAVVNAPDACAVAKDKWATYQALATVGLPQPHTVLLAADGDVGRTLDDEELQGPPVVVKTLYGTKGVGVHLAGSADDVRELQARYAESGFSILLQRRLSGREYRAFVIGERVEAFVERRAAPGEFRANREHGGELLAAEWPGAPLARTALAAARALRLDYGAVDLMETDDGVHVLEVNDSPGLQGIESATGADLATPLLRCVEAATSRKREA